MSNFTIQYLLNALAWFLGGCVVSSIYWRVWIHRRLLAVGATKKETPLQTFTFVVVVMMVAVGYLFTTSANIRLANYEQCQATIGQTNVDTINDRSKSALRQLANEIRFYKQIAAVLVHPPHPLIHQSGSSPQSRETARIIQRQIRIDQQRLAVIRADPLQPVTSCKPPQSAKG